MMMKALLFNKPLFGPVAGEKYDLIYGHIFNPDILDLPDSRQIMLGWISYVIGRQQWLLEGNDIQPSTDGIGEIWIDRLSRQYNFKCPDILAYCSSQYFDKRMDFKIVDIDINDEASGVISTFITSRDLWEKCYQVDVQTDVTPECGE